MSLAPPMTSSINDLRITKELSAHLYEYGPYLGTACNWWKAHRYHTELLMNRVVSKNNVGTNAWLRPAAKTSEELIISKHIPFRVKCVKCVQISNATFTWGSQIWWGEPTNKYHKSNVAVIARHPHAGYLPSSLEISLVQPRSQTEFVSQSQPQSRKVLKFRSSFLCLFSFHFSTHLFLFSPSFILPYPGFAFPDS